MTVDEMRNLERDSVSVKEAAEVIGCAPQRLRDMLDIDEERPLEQRRFLFPHCKVGNKRHIMRDGFIRWADGDIAKDAMTGAVQRRENRPGEELSLWDTQL